MTTRSPTRWTETLTVLRKRDGRIFFIVICAWPDELVDPKKPNKRGTQVEIDIDDPDLRHKLVMYIEHPERSCPRWRPALQTDPKTPPKVGDVIYAPSRWYIDHGEDDVCGGLATVTKVEKTQFNDRTWSITVHEHGRSYYWDGLAGDQEKHAAEYKNTWAHKCPDLPRR